MINWNEIRKQFPVTDKLAYLNSAAAGPVSRASLEAASGYYEKMMGDGDVHWNRWLADREAIRKKIEARGILFKVRVVGKELQQRQEATQPAPAQNNTTKKERNKV